jgi:hypothetical protein
MKKTKFLRAALFSSLLLAAAGLLLAEDLLMDPAYVGFFKIPAGSGAVDLDDDGLTNYEESLQWTDPFIADTDRDGFEDAMDANPVSRAYIPWGNPFFKQPDGSVLYTWPSWMLAAWAEGGQWNTNLPYAWHSPASEATASLNHVVDRDGIASNLAFRLEYFDHAASSLQIDLFNTNGIIIATNLFGNLMEGLEAETTQILEIPLSAHPAAVGIQLRKTQGQASIYSSLLYIDTDMDGLDDEQELQLGTNPLKADTDGDGLSDWAEVFLHGTDPTNPDSSGDGIPDGLAVQLGLDPTQPSVYALLPFHETFESPAIALGSLQGQGKWQVAIPDSAHVQTNTVLEGQQALALTATASENTSISHLFANAPSVVWLDMHQQVLGAATPESIPEGAAVSFFSRQGYLVVADGTRPAHEAWVTLTNAPAFPYGTWVRLTKRLDYETQTWSVWLNGVLLAETLGFASPQTQLTAIQLQDGSGIYDNIRLQADPPAALSTVMGNIVPDEWYISYLGALGHDGDDPDGDGLTNRQEYHLGTNPALSDTDGDGFSDGLEVAAGSNPLDVNCYPVLISGNVSYAGSQTGTLRVTASSADEGGTRQFALELSGPETDYAFTNLLSSRTYSISAYLDTTHDSTIHPWQPVGAYAGNPLTPTADDTSAHITLTEDTHVDTDGDGLADYDEVYVHGTAPYTFNITPENVPALTRQVWRNISGKAVVNLTANSRYPFRPDQEHELTGVFASPVNVANYYGQRILGRFLAPRTGYYAFWIASDDNGELWITREGNRQRIANVPVYTSSRQWDKYASQKSAQVFLQAGQLYPIEAIMKEDAGLDHLAVGIQFPDGRLERPMRACWFTAPPTEIDLLADSDGDGLTDYEEWIFGSNPHNPDTSADGMNDYQKIMLGLDPTRIDSHGDGLPDWWVVTNQLNHTISQANLDANGDGLSNLQNYLHGTNPWLADTDGDGVSDYDEIMIFGSNPIVMDFDGTRTELLSINGSATNASGGAWTTQGTAAVARERNGWLEYTIELNESGVFLAEFQVTQNNPLTLQDEFDLTVQVNGLYAGRQRVKAPHGSTATAIFVLPTLTSGAHTLRLTWRNIRANTFLQVNSMKIVALGGPDTSGDGIPDWQTYRLANLFDVVALQETSIVSPVCLEGTTPWIEAVEVSADYAPDGSGLQEPVVYAGIRDGWFADLHLSPTNDTYVLISGQDNSHKNEIFVTWEPIAFFQEHAYTNGLELRTGSSILVDALPLDAATNSISEIFVFYHEEVITNFVQAAEAPPVRVEFPGSGSYHIFVEHSRDDLVTNAWLDVQAVSAAFPMSDIVTVAGTPRTLAAPALPTNVVVEADTLLVMNATPRAAGGSTLTVRNDYDGPLGILARLGENGPILASTKVSTVYGDRGSYWRVTETYPDGSRMVEVRLQLGNVPEDIRVVLDIFVGGVVFDDGTRKMTLTAADFDETGSATYYMIQAAHVTTSVCHRTYYYDGNVRIK